MALINGQPDLECCGETDAIAGTAPLVARLDPDLVVMDLHLRDGETFHLIERLKGQSRSLPVLVLSQSGGAADVAGALRSGARGYLLKADAAGMLIVAIRNLLKGQFFVSKSLAADILDETVPPEHAAAVHSAAHHRTNLRR